MFETRGVIFVIVVIDGQRFSIMRSESPLNVRSMFAQCPLNVQSKNIGGVGAYLRGAAALARRRWRGCAAAWRDNVAAGGEASQRGVRGRSGAAMRRSGSARPHNGGTRCRNTVCHRLFLDLCWGC